MTFSELRTQARAIASEFARRGLFKKPILIVLDKEPRAIAAFMGAAYSGNFYVPLDLDMPKERVDKIIEKLEPSLTINKDNYAEFAESEIDETLLENASKRQIDTDLLYVLFTSGSTGTPKGVAVQHRGVIDYTDKIKDTFSIDENTIHGQAVPLFFDSSILPIYQTIMNGSSDFFIPKTTLMFAAKTVDFLIEHEVNAIYWVPTSYNIIAKSGIFDKRTPDNLKKCMFVGEVMPNSVLNVWRKALPNAMFANLMGPTEITDTYIYYKIDREFADDEPLPIGNAYYNVEALILNEKDEQCKNEEVGEICVRGSKLSAGYYNDPERTAAVFVQNPLNKNYTEIIYRTGDLGYVNERGEIMFAGRKDFQIKHAGHRIELGEIETATNGIEGVELCACVYDNENQRIVLFYCGKAEINDIKISLKEKLQPYMIPAVIQKLKGLPRTATGKIDRVTLKGDLNNI
jgi:amino acid adenylation domain-containing protein